MSAKIEVRELRGDDIFPLLDILSKIDITDEVVEMMQGSTLNLPSFPVLDINIVIKNENGDKLTKIEEKKYQEYNLEFETVLKERSDLIEERGKDNIAILLRKLLANIQIVKPEVNEFLGSMCGISGKDAGELSLPKYVSLIMKIFNSPEIMEVFSLAAQLNGNSTESLDSETSSTEDTKVH